MEQDEDLYLKASKELNSKNKREAVWVKAITLCKGDKEAAKYEYISMRVESFKNQIVSKEETISETRDLNNNNEIIYHGYIVTKTDEKNKIGWHTYKIIKAPHSDENSVGYSFETFERLKKYVDERDKSLKTSSLPENFSSNKEKELNEKLEVVRMYKNDYSKEKKESSSENNNLESSENINELGGVPVNIKVTSKTSDLENKNDELEPGRFRYICAWIIASVSSNILTTIISLMLGKNISSPAEFDAYYFYSPFIGGILALSIWIGVVNIDYYKSLKISKLTFWIFIVGGLGTIGQMYKTQMSLKISGVSAPTHFFIMTVIVFIAWVTAFYFYGAKKNRL